MALSVRLKLALFSRPNAEKRRGKGLNDEAIQRTLKNKVIDLPGLKNLLFINKRGQIIDIIALICYKESIEVLARGVMLLPQELLFIVLNQSGFIFLHLHLFGVIKKCPEVLLQGGLRAKCVLCGFSFR